MKEKLLTSPKGSEDKVHPYNYKKNPQANSILEMVTLVLGNILGTKNLQQQYDFGDMDPWSELLVSAVWANCSTHYSTLHASSSWATIIWQRYALRFKFVADWKVINVRNIKIQRETIEKIA